MPYNGIDVSSNQPETICSLVSYDFAIIKASEGTTYVNPHAAKCVRDVRSRQKMLGLYHFDKGGAWQQEADYFLNTYSKLGGKAIAVWDWEGSAVGHGKARVLSLLDYLRTKLGVVPVLYASGSPLKDNGLAAPQPGAYRVWCANYPLGNKTTAYRNDLKPYVPNPLIHQYTEHGRLPGHNSDLDLDVYFGTVETWNELAGTSTGTLPPGTTSTTSTSAPAFPLGPGQYYGDGGTKEGPGLAQWQARMAACGADLGPAGADGKYGPRTSAVATDLQRKVGLTVDGRIGPATWAAAWAKPTT
jgi:lysozyme